MTGRLRVVPSRKSAMKAPMWLGSAFAGQSQSGVHSALALNAVRFTRAGSPPGRPSGTRAPFPAGTIRARRALFEGHDGSSLLNREGLLRPEDLSAERGASHGNCQGMRGNHGCLSWPAARAGRMLNCQRNRNAICIATCPDFHQHENATSPLEARSVLCMNRPAPR